MGYTFEQLQKMGAKPVSAPVNSPSPTNPNTEKKKYTFEELQALGAKPAVQVEKPIKPQKYDVEPQVKTPENRAVKITRLQSEAKVANEEAKKANSFGGIFKNTIKGVGKTIASAEVGLGETFAKIKGSKFLDSNVNTINELSAKQVELRKLIKDREAKGLDTTSAKRTYNDNASLIEEEKRKISTYQKELPSNEKAAGQIAGVGLDLLTAGTYGKAAPGMKSFSLSKTAPTLTKKVASVVPELGKVAENSIKPTGVGTLKGLGNIAKGGGVGYVFDVTEGLQGNRGEDREGIKALIPGIGTALGTAIPLVSETTRTFQNKFSQPYKSELIAKKRGVQLDKFENGHAALKKVAQKGKERGIDVKKVLSETDILHGSVDKSGKVSTKGEGMAVDLYRQQYIDGNESIVGKALQKEAKSIAPGLVEKKLKEAVSKAGIEGEALIQAENKIKRELAGYSRRAGQSGVIPLSTLHDAKVDKYAGINFMTDAQKQRYDKTIAKALKELVEEHTKSIDVKKVNKELSKHFAVMEYLEKMDGKTVRGGKLGTYFAQVIGGVAGGQVGGIPGAVLGAEVGGKIKGNSMALTFKGKTGKIIPQAEVIKDAVEYTKKSPLLLNKAQSSSFGNNIGLNTKTQRSANTIPANIPIGANISKDVPQAKINVKGLGNLNKKLDRGFSKTGLVAGVGAATGLGTLYKKLEKKYGTEYYTNEQSPEVINQSEPIHVVAGVNLTNYATDPNHERNINQIYAQAPEFSSVKTIDDYIKERAPKSPIIGRDVLDASREYDVDPKLVIAIMQQDSMFGTKGLGSKTRNPGNVGNNDEGQKITYKTWREGVFGVAKFLASQKI